MTRVKSWLPWLAALAVLSVILPIALSGSSSTVIRGGRLHSASFAKPPKGDFNLPTRGFLLVPSLQGYDAVTLSSIPRHAAAVGCYVSGRFANCGAARIDFPGAHIVTIATWAGAVARCLDVEPRDAVPSQAGGWVHSMYYKFHIWRPCVYADASEMPSVRSSLRAWGNLGGTDLWLADWDGRPAIPSGFAAKQWFSNCCVDRDTFTLAFFGSPKPKPRLKCFGPHAQLRNATCIRVRREVASWSRARDASHRAYLRTQKGLAANHCRRPYRRDVCVDLGREIGPRLLRQQHYFDARVQRALRTY